jgi:predicted  nucleic acid-binding Zn-ribbon protein
VENPNRETEKNYYESIISSRMARIRGNENDEAAKQRAANKLNENLSNFKSKYQTAMIQLEECKNVFPSKMASIQKQIDTLHERLVDTDKKEVDIINQVGHQGSTLIQCLIEVRTFAKTLKNGTSAYAPLVSILTGKLSILVFFLF